MLPVLIELQNIARSFGRGRKNRKLILFDSLTLRIGRGETLGIMGQSGIGKTTLGKIIAGLEVPSRGKVLYRGSDIRRMRTAEYNTFRRRVQMLFQDPEGTLNPRKTIGETLSRVRLLTGASKASHRKAVKKVCAQVGLHPNLLDLLPWQLSGGINQRVALARILILEPELIILDEPTSALDLSIQAQILRLLKQIQKERGISYVFISHDRPVVEWMSHRIGHLENRSLLFRDQTE